MINTDLHDIFLKAWSLPRNIYLRDFAHILAKECLDCGLIGCWQQINLDLQLSGSCLPIDQHEYVQSLSANAENLINELADLQLNSQKTIRDDIRLLGLIGLCVSRSDDLSPQLFERISFHREAIDIFCLSILHSRNYKLVFLLHQASSQFSEISRTFESLLTLMEYFTSPLSHRYNILSDDEFFFISPWEDLTGIFNDLSLIVCNLHDLNYKLAVNQTIAVSNKYPSCPIIIFLNSTCHYFVDNLTPDVANLDLDAMFLYGAEYFNFKIFDLLIYLNRCKKFTSMSSIILNLGLPKYGLDHDFLQLFARLKSQIFYSFDRLSEHRDWIESSANEILSNSNYDPFKLTLFSSQLTPNSLSLSNVSDSLQPAVPCRLTFLTGLPGPHWSQLRSYIRSAPNFACMCSDLLIESVYNVLFKNTTLKYPSSLPELNLQQVFNARNFYLQNLSFCFGGKDVNGILDIIPGSFIHLPLLSYLFPEAKFVIINPDIKQSILASYLQVNGFSSEHCTASLSELTAYSLDYASIISHLKSIFPECISIFNLDNTDNFSQFNVLFELLDIDLSINSTSFDDSLIDFSSMFVNYDFLHEQMLELEDELTETLSLLNPP